ncbi:MAG TPA: hypothetical protein VFM77_15170, partial [Terriglobales bacterium]|nr:hypothetical protein [Terriglobales bacterium]
SNREAKRGFALFDASEQKTPSITFLCKAVICELHASLFLYGESRCRFLVPRSGARTLIFTGQAFCHFLVLSLFPLLFLLALLECLWTSTWYALLPSENEKVAIRSCLKKQDQPGGDP